MDMMDTRSKARLRAVWSAHLAGALICGICAPAWAAAAKPGLPLRLERTLRLPAPAPADADADADAAAPAAGFFTLGGAAPSERPPAAEGAVERNIVIVSHSRAAVALDAEPSWEIAPADRTLGTALARWAVRAGWQLVWELPVDYAVDARTQLSGSFEEAVAVVAKGMEGAEMPLKAIFYAGNKVLRVVPKGAE
jgi:hypothetical protein